MSNLDHTMKKIGEDFVGVFRLRHKSYDLDQNRTYQMGGEYGTKTALGIGKVVVRRLKALGFEISYKGEKL